MASVREKIDAINERFAEDRSHFMKALRMIEELSTDEWSRQIATTALRLVRETPPQPLIDRR